MERSGACKPVKAPSLLYMAFKGSRLVSPPASLFSTDIQHWVKFGRCRCAMSFRASILCLVLSFFTNPSYICNPPASFGATYGTADCGPVGLQEPLHMILTFYACLSCFLSSKPLTCTWLFGWTGSTGQSHSVLVVLPYHESQ